MKVFVQTSEFCENSRFFLPQRQVRIPQATEEMVVWGGGVTQMFIHAAGPLNPSRQLWAKYSVLSKMHADSSICRAYLNANVQSRDALTEGDKLQRPSLTLFSPSGITLADAGKH